MMSLAGPLGHALFRQESQESFENQLNVFLNAAKTFKIDQQICDILDQIEQPTSLEGVDNEVAKAYGNVALILATFKKTLSSLGVVGRHLESGVRKWASNQPDVDCVFETEESSNRELAYCKVLRDENYDLIFKLRKTSGLYSSKLESLYQIYNGQPVQTEIKRNKISVCAFEWKVDQYIRIFEPENGSCPVFTASSIQADEGVCFYDHKNLGGFKYCSKENVGWVHNDLNDEFSSYTISPGYCVKVYEHANYNALKTGKDKLLMGSTSNTTSVTIFLTIGTIK